ncbi:hypothetical protein C7441_107152 [Pseudaminobacter salicylatoxidans]|uniref:2-oxoglutarate-Fe(II)-dependent oxygenase superfamily protein n=1 Tax=Pseudaminobacter salicylatoxidans TaxID=93369 RepID=A0A316C2X4_PSESE|nr:hypothetical protein [Pseudaminobacter salicylatoxidans]PWJ83991.1 hypothetical protein C7441_107152 [Pseudaminobacter salicylatoxidans]
MSAVAKAENNSLTQELIAHAVASIEAADRFSKPFPHIFFRNFFPKDFYADMIKSIPTEGYDPIKDNGTRMALRLYGDNVDKVDASVREMWAAVSAMLTSSEVENAIRNQLHEGLEIRARGDKVAGPDALRLVAKPVLYRDKDGYQIKPHPDTRKKVVTMQLYCPADESQHDLGTTLYQASLKGLVHVGSYGLEPVKTLPFLPNVGYAFVVLKAYHSLLKMSWHGRPKIHTPIEQQRITLLNTFYINENVGF